MKRKDKSAYCQNESSNEFHSETLLLEAHSIVRLVDHSYSIQQGRSNQTYNALTDNRRTPKIRKETGSYMRLMNIHHLIFVNIFNAQQGVRHD